MIHDVGVTLVSVPQDQNTLRHLLNCWRSRHSQSSNFRWCNGCNRAQRLIHVGVTVIAAPNRVTVVTASSGTIHAGVTVTATPRSTVCTKVTVIIASRGKVHAEVTVVSAPKGSSPSWGDSRSRVQRYRPSWGNGCNCAQWENNSRVWRRSQMHQATESRRPLPLSHLSSDREHALAAHRLCASA